MLQCAGVKDEDKQRLAAQLLQLDEGYPGGILQYVSNAKRLLQDSREGANLADKREYALSHHPLLSCLLKS